MLTHGRKASLAASASGQQFWQQFATQQLKEILGAELKVTDFSNCTKKKDLIKLCTDNRLDKRVFDKWATKFKENRAASRLQLRASSPSGQRPIASNIARPKMPDALQASRHAREELHSNRRPSLGVDPNTIFDTSESIADEDTNSSATPPPVFRMTTLKKSSQSPPSRGTDDRKVRRAVKKVPRLNIPNRQRALQGAITARRDADNRLQSMRNSPIKTKRDYETAAAEHALTASLQMLSELPLHTRDAPQQSRSRPPSRDFQHKKRDLLQHGRDTPSQYREPPHETRLFVPPETCASFISDGGGSESVADLTPLLPQKVRTKTTPSHCDELTQAKASQAQGGRPSLNRSLPPRDSISADETRTRDSHSKESQWGRPLHSHAREQVGPAPTPNFSKTPTVNSRTPAIVKRPSMANSAIRRRALAEAKLVKRQPEEQNLYASKGCGSEENATTSSTDAPSENTLQGASESAGSWNRFRLWIFLSLGLLVSWVACGGVSGLGNWSSRVVRSGEPIEFCASSNGPRSSTCVPCPQDAECANGQAQCASFHGLSGAPNRWRCVSYKSLIYDIAIKSLPEMAAHLRAQDRKRGCSLDSEKDGGGHFEDLWDLFDLYLAPSAAAMPESWYTNPSLPSWGLDTVEDSKRSDLMTILYSDILTEQNLAKYSLLKHASREYALGAFSRSRLFKCKAKKLLSHSLLISASLIAIVLVIPVARRYLRAQPTLAKPSPSPSPSPARPPERPAMSVSLARRQTRLANKPLH